MALEHGIGVAYTCLIDVVYFLAGQVLVRQPDIELETLLFALDVESACSGPAFGSEGPRIRVDCPDGLI